MKLNILNASFIWVVAIFVYSSSSYGFGVEVKPLSKKELTPWCSNPEIWGALGVSTEKCLEVGVPCSREVSEQTKDQEVSMEKLFRCMFDRLNIDLPASSDS